LTISSLFQKDSLSLLRELMGIERDCEITVEANPETITAGYLEQLRELGINRLSIGIQTTRPSQLRRLERLSTRDKIFESVDLAIKYFENVNLDLMIGIPEQTEENLFDDLEFISKTKPQHMSVYILTLEPDHIWFKSKVLSSQLADAETVERLYCRAINFLTTLGYEHYEVSNFAQPGFASKHNKNYWDTQSSYLALGPGAHGYLKSGDGKRWRTVNHRSIEKFFQSESGLESFECLTSEQKSLEELYMRLRTRVPLVSGDLEIAQFEHRAAALIDSGLAILVRGGLVLTDRGWLLMEKVAEYLV
jgi:oxygen-independent coproporphyrinogen-3 oxidase